MPQGKKAETAFTLAIYSSSEEEKDGWLLALLCSWVYWNAVPLSTDDTELMRWNLSQILKEFNKSPHSPPQKERVYNR